MRRTFVRSAGPLMALGAVALFWVFGHGRWSSASVTGFAEAVDHPAAPLEAGRVAEVMVRLGQEVKAGAPLARLEADELRRKQESAEIALRAAEAALTAEEVVQRSAVARAELLVLRLENAQSQNRAQLAEVDQQVKRLTALAGEQLVPAGTLEESRLLRARLAASVATLDEARKQKQAGLGKPLKEQITAEEVAKRLAPFKETVHLRELAVASARAAVEGATLRAAADGIVSGVFHLAGDVVAAGAEVVRVTSGRPGVVVCWLPEREAARVWPGKSVLLREKGLLARGFDAHVVDVSPVIEEIPVRARDTLNVPAWGRRVVLSGQPAHPLIWGEALHVDL